MLNRLAAVTVQVVAWWSKPLLLSCPSPSIIVSLVTALLWETACHVASPPGGGLAVARPQSTAHCALSMPHFWMCCVNIAWDTTAYFHLFIKRWRVRYKLGLYTSFPVLELIWFFFFLICMLMKEMARYNAVVCLLLCFKEWRSDSDPSQCFSRTGAGEDGVHLMICIQ